MRGAGVEILGVKTFDLPHSTFLNINLVYLGVRVILVSARLGVRDESTHTKTSADFGVDLDDDKQLVLRTPERTCSNGSAKGQARF